MPSMFEDTDLTLNLSIEAVDGKHVVVRDGEAVAICASEERARELAFSIWSAATGFRDRALAAFI